jgi:DNA-binding NarL/FixJ family response regulator
MGNYAFKNGYFSKFRSDWSDMDRTIVNGLSRGKYVREIADSLDLKERYVQRIVESLRKGKNVKNNMQLVELAVKEKVIE